MAAPPAPATIGPYRIVRLLGEGGMGSVYEGVHEATSRRVAIKVLLPDYARDPVMTTRFFNEARAVNKIEHPGILQIFDYGQQENGCAYIAMEFLNGETLSARLARGPAVRPLGESLRLGWQLASALSAAHEKGIIHRDLKPDNIMIVRDADAPGGEKTKLLDFGIAKLAEAARGSQPKTQSQMVMGTPQYMSPEQCKGASHVDDKTDVYALGVLLFELLAGRTPFMAESGGEYIGMHLFKQPPQLHELAPSVPPELAACIDSLLVKDPARRPSMAELGTKLGQFVRRYGSPSYSSERHYVQSGRENSPTVRLGPTSTLGRSIGQLGRSTLSARSRIIGSALLLGVVIVGAAGLRAALRPPRTLAIAPTPASTPTTIASTTQPVPVSPPAKTVRWTIISNPAGAAVVDASGKLLGRTPWQQTAAAAKGTRTLVLQQAGYVDLKLSLEGDEDADRQVRLHALPVEKNVVPPKRPIDKKLPSKIEYID